MFVNKSTFSYLQFLSFENPSSFDHLAAIFVDFIRHRQGSKKGPDSEGGYGARFSFENHK